jgi:hypothetical protein
MDVLKLNKAWVLSLAFALLWALSAFLSNAYTPAPSAFASAKIAAPCEPNAGQPDRKAVGESAFLEPEDGSFAHLEFAKPLKLYFLAEEPAENSPGIEIYSPKLATLVVNPFAYLLTPVLVL